MGRVHYSQQANDDLIEIWLWIARDSTAIADAIIDRIERRAAQLAHHPEIGVARHEIGEGAKGLVAERWLVLYHLTDGGVLIVRIVDGARDLGQLDWPGQD